MRGWYVVRRITKTGGWGTGACHEWEFTEARRMSASVLWGIWEQNAVPIVLCSNQYANSSGCSWTELQLNPWIAMKAGLLGQPLLCGFTVLELCFWQFKNCENHNVIILILIILIIVMLILSFPFRKGIDGKWLFYCYLPTVNNHY